MAKLGDDYAMYLRSCENFILLVKKTVMPASRHALIRYKTIDNCLRNRFRKWTLDDLMDACADALAEYEGCNNGIGRRTIQLDIQNMRSEKLGYNAPIVVYDHKYYTYEDPEYSITKTPVNEQDMKQINAAVAILKQLSGFSQFGELEQIVDRLDAHVSSICHHVAPVIFFDKNDALKGLEHLSFLHQAILAKKVLCINYKSFNAHLPETFSFSAYILKEYNNRWFLIGKKRGSNLLLNLALDRILKVKTSETDEFEENTMVDFNTFYGDVIGVTKGLNTQPANVCFWADAKQAPYIQTKPLHHSQKLVALHADGSADFKIKVCLNFELEKVLLGFGDGIIVKSPRLLVKRLKERIDKCFKNYNEQASQI